MDKQSGADGIALSVPEEAERTVGFPQAASGEEERITPDADPFPGGDPPPDASEKSHPRKRLCPTAGRSRSTESWSGT